MKVKKRLLTIIDSENISILDISTSTILLAFEIAEAYKTGGRDSLIAASLFENNIKEVYSYDTDFDDITRIKRIDPITEK